MPSSQASRRVLLVYNTDYDDELKAQSGADVSAVQEAAMAVARGIRDVGHPCDVHGVRGRDIGVLIERLIADPPDLVFNLCESMEGDTRNELLMPALLDMLGVPYTGPGAMVIGTCLDKEQSKLILRHHKVATPDYVVVRDIAELDHPADPLGLDQLAYPMFAKLVREDASIGIEASNRAADPAALRARCRELLLRYRQPVLVEQYIEGREVNVTVIGEGDTVEVLPLFEIDFAKMPDDRPRVLSYAAKWDESHVDYIGTVPVPMTDVAPAIEAAIRDTAARAYRALAMRDFGRVDLRVDAEGVPWVIDVNPNCDLSPDAGLARTARSYGLDYPQLVGRVCELAWRRHGR